MPAQPLSPSALAATTLALACAAGQVFAQPSMEVRWRKIVVTGDELPGAGGETFRSPGHAIMNRRGEVAFGARFETPDRDEIDSAIFAEIDGELRMLLRQGDPVAGIPGARHGITIPLRMNYTDQNELVFYNEHDFGEGTDRILGIWRANRDRVIPVMLGDG